MSNSKIGQYQLEYRLDGFLNPTRSHLIHMWISVQGNPAPGTLPADINVMTLSGATKTLQAVADQVWSFLRLSYPAAITCVSFNTWKYVTENAKDFLAAGNLAAPAGTGGGSTIAGQCTLTFRHALGGIGKIVMLESANGGDTRTTLIPNAAGTPTARLAAFVMSADSPMIALDNSFPVSPLRDSRGQNEAIWRQIYRSGN